MDVEQGGREHGLLCVWQGGRAMEVKEDRKASMASRAHTQGNPPPGVHVTHQSRQESEPGAPVVAVLGTGSQTAEAGLWASSPSFVLLLTQ